MCKLVRDKLFYIGILIFSIVMFCEHLFLGENNFTCFLKGFACAFEIVGIIFIFKNKGK